MKRSINFVIGLAFISNLAFANWECKVVDSILAEESESMASLMTDLRYRNEFESNLHDFSAFKSVGLDYEITRIVLKAVNCVFSGSTTCDPNDPRLKISLYYKGICTSVGEASSCSQTESIPIGDPCLENVSIRKKTTIIDR